MGKGLLLEEEPIKRIAKRYGKTPAQILIRWSIQNDVVTIPKSTKQHRVYENMQVYETMITERFRQLVYQNKYIISKSLCL